MQTPERDLDTAIDRAVRELMDVDADAAFRARVAARLQQRPRRGFGGRHIALAGAAAAVLLAAFVFNASKPGPVPPQMVEHHPSPVAPPAAAPSRRPTAPSTGPRTMAEGREPVRGAAARQSPGRGGPMAVPPIARNVVVAAVAPDDPVMDIETLAVVTPISLAAVAPRQIATEAIEVVPLDPIAEIQVAPLTPRRERD
jgi:hypothetical protein